MDGLRDRIEREVARLNALAPFQIAEEFITAGCRGNRRESLGCPLANWFRRLIADMQLASGEDPADIYIGVDGNFVRIGTGPVCRVDLRRAGPDGIRVWSNVTRFIEQFDMKRYPELDSGVPRI